MPAKILGVEVVAMCHATEEFDKVLLCIKNLISFEFGHSAQRTYGHFKNQIDVITVSIKKQKEIEKFLKNLSEKLSARDRNDILRNFEQHFEEGRLYLRLDKMRAYCGEAALGEGVHVAISATSYPYDEKAVKKTLRESFEDKQ